MSINEWIKNCYVKKKKKKPVMFRTSLVVQWLRTDLPGQGTWV